MREYKTLKFSDDEEGLRQREQTRDKLLRQGWAVQSESRLSTSNGSETLLEFYRNSDRKGPNGDRYSGPRGTYTGDQEDLEDPMDSPEPSFSRRRRAAVEDIPPERRRRSYYAERFESRRNSRFLPGLLLGIAIGALSAWGLNWWLGSPSMPEPAPTSASEPLIVVPQDFGAASAPQAEAPSEGSVAAVPVAQPAESAAGAPAAPAQRRGVVVGVSSSSRVNIRQNPTTSSQRLATVSLGQELPVLEERNVGSSHPWYRISGSFGEGWIYGQYLQVD